MSDIAIRATGLGKKYFIGARRQEPQTIGESIKGLLTSPFNYLRSSLRGPSEEETLWALQDVSFEIKRGETVAIIGRNGAGKSTLLRVLARITEPTTGQVEVFGQVASLLEIGTGFHQELTGRENVYVNGALLGLSKADINRRFDEIVDFAGVERFIDTPVKRYSKGMHVRLAFSVAVNFFAEIMLLDEVLAVGDQEFREKCLKRMMAEAKSGRTIIFVSHQLGQVGKLCQRGLLLEKGQLIYGGDIDSTLNLYLGREDTNSPTQAEEIFSEEPSPTSASLPPEKLVQERPPEDETRNHLDIIKINNISSRNLSHCPQRIFEYTESITFRAEIAVIQKNLNLCSLFALFDSSENVVLVSKDTDLSDSFLTTASPGIYFYEFAIPGKLLKPGEYLCRFKIYDNLSGVSLDRVDSGLSFTIIDTRTKRGALNTYHKLAVIAPEITWTFHPIETPRATQRENQINSIDN